MSLNVLSTFNWKNRIGARIPIIGEPGTVRNRIAQLVYPCIPASFVFVRKTILEVVRYNLLRIKKTDGYNNDLKDVFIVPRSIEQMVNFPCINLFIDTKETMVVWGNGTRVHQDTTLQLDCFVRSVNDPMTAQENILYDVQRLFGNWYWMPDEFENYTHNVIYLRSTLFGEFVNTPIVGISIFFKLDRHYMTTTPEIEA